MILADTTLLNISINLLLVVFVIVCLLMSLLILMQRPKQEGLGAAFGGGVTDQVFGARTTNVLQKGTVYLGSMFFILALTLAILIGKKTKPKTLLDPAAIEESAKKAKEAKISDTPAEEPISPISVAPSDEPPAPVTEETPAPTTGETPAPAPEEVPVPEDKPADAAVNPLEVPVPPPAEENETDKPE